MTVISELVTGERIEDMTMVVGGIDGQEVIEVEGAQDLENQGNGNNGLVKGRVNHDVRCEIIQESLNSVDFDKMGSILTANRRVVKAIDCRDNGGKSVNRRKCKGCVLFKAK